jgi:hypothetical protein
MAELAEWDEELLMAELEGLAAEGITMDDVGFDLDALEALGASVEPEGNPEADAEPQIDKAEELRAKWGVEPGQLWELGDHRLLCGDSTKKEDVDRVMGGERASLLLADPPYGMRLNTNFADRPLTDKAKAKHPKQKNYAPVIGDEADFDPTEVMKLFSDAGEQFWWGADYYRNHLPDGGSWIVWDKRAGIEDVKYTSAEFELCWSKKPHARTILRVRWFGLCGTESQDVKTRIHPNQKPIQLYTEFISAHSSDAAVVAEPFSGSGTTIIACEQLGRKCRAIEISPAYCAVAIERWSAATGKTPRRIS